MLPSDVECMHPVRHMGYHADVRQSSRNPQTSKAVKDKFSSARADQSIRLHDQLILEKPISKSYADLHHEVKRTLGDAPLFPRKSLGNFQKSYVERRPKDDELVKHMSNLPRYLQRVEKGENVQEKVLNVGVLDWGRLENWKYNQKPVTHRPIMYSPSTSNTSSPFSTVGSSTLSTGSDSGVLAPRKQSPSDGAHLASSSKGSHSMVVKPTRANVPAGAYLASSSKDGPFMGAKPTRANVAAIQDKATVSKNASAGQQKISGTNVSSQRNHSKTMFEKGMKNDVNLKFIKEMGTSSSNSKGCEASFSPKGKTKVPEVEYVQKIERSQESTSVQHGRDKTIVLLLPKSSSQNRFSGPSRNAEGTTLSDSKQAVPGRSSFSDGFCINEEVQFSELCSDISHSCPQLSRAEHKKLSDMNRRRSVDALDSEVLSDVFHSLPNSGEMHTVRSDCMQAEDNKMTPMSTDLMMTEQIKGSVLKAQEQPSARRGNQSPNHWPSVRNGKVTRSLSFKEGSALPQLSSTYVTAKSGPVESHACSESSSTDKLTANTRGRSSPLRRLLDPLLRPKTANPLASVDALRVEAKTICKLSDQPLVSSVQPGKGNSNFSGSRIANNNGTQPGERYVVSMVQALLQVTVKNGLPWFTFAVDNSSDILAATMRKTSSSEKYDCSWIYTFYSFRKAKKKSGGWMGHGSKASNRDYVPNIVAQMKVNGSRCSNSTKHDSKGQLAVREFVLFGVEPKKADQDAPELLSNVELAAMVIKVPTETIGSLTSDKQQSRNYADLSNIRYPENPLDKKCSYNSIGNLRGARTVGCQSLSSIAVVLPSGVHGLSASGLPSPLLDRWKSGGSCDCGGWDVGCQLRILSSQDQHPKNLESTEFCCAQDKFDLYIQGGRSRESMPSFSFATYNKGVHSIDFNASISSLQAFSICIAFLHCQNLAKVSNLFQEITMQEPISMESERIKLSTQAERKAPASSAQFPPPSPVGRV